MLITRLVLSILHSLSLGTKYWLNRDQLCFILAKSKLSGEMSKGKAVMTFPLTFHIHA
jgi:hypothetical protein